MFPVQVRRGAAFCHTWRFAQAGDLLFIMNDAAELLIARANPSDFEALKTYVVANSATWAQPVMSGRRLFVKDVSNLTLWTFD
jgi:hypothetical protein